MDRKETLLNASELAGRGDYVGASKLLESLVVKYPDSALVNCSLANAYWNLDRLDDAVDRYKRAVKLSPKSQPSSLGLFHCLWELKRTDEAVEELKRFLSVSESEDHEKILKQISESKGSG